MWQASAALLPHGMQAELCGLRMQLVNLRRCSIASMREAETQHLLAKQQELNTTLNSLISSTANQHGLSPAMIAAGVSEAVLSATALVARAGDTDSQRCSIF